ncbi:MAG: tyrosine-type recombinase/integrase [Janthinobacterium lividum]
MSREAALSVTDTAEQAFEARLLALVLNGVTSVHSRRSYRTSLVRFFAWIRTSGSAPTFTKALVGEYRAALLQAGLSPATLNLRLAPIRRLAREMADNDLLDPAVAAAIERVPGVTRRGTRLGNWLTKEQANDLLNAPDPKTLAGKRDRAILALLIGCGLRRAELLRLDVESVQQREARWVIPDLEGKGNRVRTVTVPAGVKARLDLWTNAACITEGRIFRPVTKAGVVKGSAILDEKVVWRLVVRYARETDLGKLAPHDLRRTCAKLCRKAGGDLEQIQLLLGHASVQTTERYLGTEQALVQAVNDGLGLELS